MLYRWLHGRALCDLEALTNRSLEREAETTGIAPPPHCQVCRERSMEVDGDLRSLLLAQLLDVGLEDQEALRRSSL